jgi:phosphate transport system permease protein
MNPNHDHYPEGESFRRSLSGRYRTASIWQALFFSALVIAILSLAALLYNIMDGSFGYVAFEYKNDPTKFTAKPLDDLNQQELLDILKTNLSSGAFTKLDNAKPMVTRSKTVLYTLVLERLIQIDTKQTWSMTDSVLRSAESRSCGKIPRSKA